MSSSELTFFIDTFILGYPVVLRPVPVHSAMRKWTLWMVVITLHYHSMNEPVQQLKRLLKREMLFCIKLWKVSSLIQELKRQHLRAHWCYMEERPDRLIFSGIMY